MEAVRADYEQEFDIPLQVQYGPSQTLLSSLEVSKSGDLYLPADDSFLARARERDLIDDEFALADMKAVVAVAKGNPKKIAKLDDLLRDEIRVAQGSTEATAIGKVTKAALAESGEWETLEQHTTAVQDDRQRSGQRCENRRRRRWHRVRTGAARLRFAGGRLDP